MRKDSSPEDGLILQFWSSKIVNAASLIRWEYMHEQGTSLTCVYKELMYDCVYTSIQK